MSQNKGVKISCLSCSRENRKWINYNSLIEFDVEKDMEESQKEIDEESNKKDDK